MDTETRLLEEWKANHDLLKFYEDLKQKRFAHFLTIQTAFLAFFALIAKDALETMSLTSLSALVFIAVPPLIIVWHFIRVDRRNRAFVDTANTHLLLLEDAWKAQSPDNHFSTYRNLFAILSRHDVTTIQRFVSARDLQDDPIEHLMKSTSAHASEHSILRMFLWLWIVLGITALLVHAHWHWMHGFG